MAAFILNAELQTSQYISPLVGDETEDTVLDDLISEVSLNMERYMGYEFTAQVATVQYLDGGKELLYINAANLSSVAINIDASKDFGSSTVIATTDYTIYEDEGFIELDFIPIEGNKIVQVTFDGGYATASIPADLKRACKLQCTVEWQRKHDMATLGTTHPDGTRVVNSMDEFIPSVTTILNRRKRYEF